MATHPAHAAAALGMTLALGSCATTPEATEAQPQVIRLEHADCRAVQQSLHKLNEGVERGQQLVAIPHAETNSILLSGAPETVDQAKDLIARLDLPQAQPQVIRLEHADCRAVQQSLHKLNEGVERGQQLVAIPHAETNSILLSGAPETVDQAKDLIARLDLPTPRPQVVRLTHADCSAVQQSLRKLNEGVERGQRLVAIPHAATNSILLSGAPEIVDQAKDLIARLDQPKE